MIALVNVVLFFQRRYFADAVTVSLLWRSIMRMESAPNEQTTGSDSCTGNSARSQMAEGLLRSIAGDRFEVFSAGTKPAGLNSNAVVAMLEMGIDISHQRSKSVDDFAGQPFDYVITVCDNAREACPFFPGVGKAGFITALRTPPPYLRINNWRFSGGCATRSLRGCKSSFVTASRWLAFCQGKPRDGFAGQAFRFAAGHLDICATCAACAPVSTFAPISGELAKQMTGIHPQRKLPKLTPGSFDAWAKNRNLHQKRETTGPEVAASGLISVGPDDTGWNREVSLRRL